MFHVSVVYTKCKVQCMVFVLKQIIILHAYLEQSAFYN